LFSQVSEFDKLSAYVNSLVDFSAEQSARQYSRNQSCGPMFV